MSLSASEAVDGGEVEGFGANDELDSPFADVGVGDIVRCGEGDVEPAAVVFRGGRGGGETFPITGGKDGSDVGGGAATDEVCDGVVSSLSSSVELRGPVGALGSSCEWAWRVDPLLVGLLNNLYTLWIAGARSFESGVAGAGGVGGA